MRLSIPALVHIVKYRINMFQFGSMHGTRVYGTCSDFLQLSTMQCAYKNDAITKPELSTDVAVGAANAATKFVEKDGRKIAYRKVRKGPAMILCNRFRGT
jgi:hypothetical protein